MGLGNVDYRLERGEEKKLLARVYHARYHVPEDCCAF